MTELNFPGKSGDAAAKVSAELLAGAVVVGVIAYAVGKSVLSWLESLEDKHHRGQLLAAYRRRHSWKKSDIPRLESLGVNHHAKLRMQRLAGLGRPVVTGHRPLHEILLDRVNTFALLVGSEATPEDRKRFFRTWPWWKHHVEAYYRGEHALARRQGLRNPSLEAEIKVGRTLGMSQSAVHAICAEIRRMRQEDELSANFPAETLEDYERWMNFGAAATFPDEPRQTAQPVPEFS